MPKLTKKVVDAAVPREAPFFLWCSDLPGFGLRIFPTGKRVYYADYRTQDGTRRRMSLGQHGKLTVEEARKVAIVTLGSVIRGEDPAGDRAARRKAATVAELCDRYLEATDAGLVLGRRGTPKKASTLYSDRGRIEHHIKPLLGSRPVAALTPAEVQRFVRDVQTGKTARSYKTRPHGKVVARGGAGAAARTTGLLGGIMSFAVSEGIITTNPVNGVKRPADKKRKRRLTPEEYGRLGKVLAEAEANREGWQGYTGVRLLCLTGCRLQEVARLRWSEVDLAGSCLRLEDSKEGYSVRPLGRAAVTVLQAIKRQAPSPFVLPAVRGSKAYAGLPDAIERYMRAADLPGVGAHTLRHSFASTAGDLGYSEPTIAAMLGHAGGSVTSRYVHHLDAVLIAAADRVAEQIAESLEKDLTHSGKER